MLTLPLGAMQSYWVPGGGVMFTAVPQSNWYMFGTKAEAQKVLALAQQNFPEAKLTLVSGTQNGNAPFMVLPNPNPLGIDVWIISGTLPTASGGSLQVADYAGYVFDRGPLDQAFGGSPAVMDNNGAYGALGGENLTYVDEGGGGATFKWSATPQQPVS